MATRLRKSVVALERAKANPTPSNTAGVAAMTDICTLTLGAIYDQRPCGINPRPERRGFSLLLHNLGEPDRDWNPARIVSLGDIALSNGAADAWWCASMLDWSRIDIRRAVVRALLPCVHRASDHTIDRRVHGCIAGLARWCDGDDGVDLKVLARAAWEAYESSSGAPMWAARAAHWAASLAVFPPPSAMSPGAAALASVEAAGRRDTRDAELAAQVADLVAAFPPIAMRATAPVGEV